MDEHSGMPAARIPVRWEVAEDAACTRIVRSGETLAMPELGHSVHVEVAGLQPHRPSWYRFAVAGRSEAHTSELQSLMRISYAVFRLQKNTRTQKQQTKIER